MDRRAVLESLLGVLTLSACSRKSRTRRAQESPAGPRVAVSLTQLQDRSREAVQNTGSIPGEIASLYGLTRIDGFTVEESDGILLLGQRDPGRAPLELDDLLVALRNAYEVSEDYAGTPGCTIDPDPQAKDPWRIQIGKVFGMPNTARMGGRHLAVDYELKRVAAGLTRLPQKGIEVRSVFELALADKPVCETSDGPGRSEVTHRFWFCSLMDTQSPRFEHFGAGALVRHAVNVQVLSEEEFLARGKRTGGGPPRPDAAAFCQAITQVLAGDEIPEYVHLRNDFRLVELAKLMRFKQASESSLDYLLRGCPLAVVDVPSAFGGVRRDESGEAVCESVVSRSRGVSEKLSRYRREFRGGVEVLVELSSTDFAPKPAASAVAARVMRSRPRGGVAAWEF